MIPDSVTTIGEYVFYNCKSLANIAIPDGVTMIGEYAFNGCSSLTSVTIGNSVTAIGDYTFSGCTSLTNVTIPNNVTEIGLEAFFGCTSLTSVTIPDSVATIGDWAFNDCGSLTSVTIPDSVTTIGDYAFQACISLKSLTIGNSVTTIGEGAFYACGSLTSVTIPDSVTTIGDYAFNWCNDIQEFKGKFAADGGRCLIKDNIIIAYANASGTEYTIPDTVAQIGTCTFRSCYSLISLTIPNSVTIIGDGAFAYCGSLTSVTVPDSVTTIGEMTFERCEELIKITIPDSVTMIGDSAFSCCYSLEEVYFKATTPPTIGSGVFDVNATGRKIYVPASADDNIINAYKSAVNWSEYADDIYEIQPSKNEIWYTNGSTTEATTPYSTDVFGANIVSNLYDTEKGCWVITFDGDVTTIGYHAFIYCDSLTSVTIPDSVTTIGAYAFSWCSSLTSVTISDSVTTIGNYAFHDCRSLTSVTIPDSVTTIVEGAFSGCSNLTAFYGKFASEDNRCLIVDGVLNSFAPSGLTAYNTPDSVTTIGDDVFDGCSSLTSVTIPDSVTTIGDTAFGRCQNLTSITIPNSVTTINNWAFDGCSSLVSATIGDGVTMIGEGVFAHCDNLAEFKGKYATENGRCLVKDNAIVAYANASGTEYTIPDDIEMIEKSAFRGCTYLTAVIIPSGVKAIGINAFLDCGNLTEVYCKSTTPPTLGNGAFNENADDRKIYVPAESVGAYKSAAYWSNYADAIVGYDFGNAGITDWNNVYVRSAFNDCKLLMMEASGFTGEFYLYKLGAKKSDALAAAVYTVGAWEYTTSRDYCEDASSKINGVTLKSGEVVVETSGDGYKVTFNVVDKNGTEWKGTYTGGITQP